MTPTNAAEVEKQKPKRHRSLIVSTLVKELQEWGEHSTLHGVPAVLSRDSSKLRRLFWMFVLGASIFALHYGYKWQIERYFEYRTLTKDTIRHEDSLPFPAITICSTCLLRNDSFENETEQEILLDIYSQTNASVLLDKYDAEYLNNFKLSEIYIKHGLSEEKMFYSCHWGGHYVNCSKYVEGHLFSGEFCYTINGRGKKMESSTVGRDNSFYMVLFTNQDNFFIAEYASAGFRMLIHDHHQEPDMTSSTFLSPGFSYYIGLSKTEYNLMKSPVKAFGDSECLDTMSPTFTNPLQHFDNYSYSACKLECLMHFVYNICGCVNPVHQGLIRECDPVESLSCSFPARDKFYRNSTENIERCGCLIPCEFNEFNTKVSFAYFPSINYLKMNADSLPGRMQDMNYTRANYLSVSIFFETKVVKTKEQILEFPKLDLLASLSGYLGLAVGASIVTFLEFSELFFVSFSKCFGRH